jgi:hypothetical protein
MPRIEFIPIRAADGTITLATPVISPWERIKRFFRRA